MKKTLGTLCLLLLPVLAAVLLTDWAVFLLPPQYQQTFVGALQAKLQRLSDAVNSPRIIVIGGSSVAFGQSSDLLERELPGYEVVNFGLYAGLGTDAMLDLALPDIRPNDVVIISPEQNEQALSDFFGAENMWRATEGDTSMLLRLNPQNAARLIAAMPEYAAHKFKLWQSGQMPQGDGIYRSDNFNRWGDVLLDYREKNSMPGAYDPNMMICFDAAMLHPAFIQHMNEFAKACQNKGVAVYYRFCPMNAAAVTAVESAKQTQYEEMLRSMLSFPVLGSIKDSVMDSAWFYDTNFHLNASGVLVNTAMMAAQLQTALGLPQQASIKLPDPPTTAAAQQEIAAVDEDAWFAAETRGDGVCIIGLTAAGAQQETLALPAVWNGQPVTSFTASTFAGNQVIREITLPESIRRIDDGSFAQCSALEYVILQQSDPSRITVGSGLFKGTSCLMKVPHESYSQYQTSYFWSIHAARIRPEKAENAQEQLQAPQKPVSGPVMYADANGGISLSGEQRAVFAVSKTHLRTNTPMGQQLFIREGYAPLCWNTKPDGSGEDIAFGSRTESMDQRVLYMKWIKETPLDLLNWKVQDGAVIVTGWQNSESCLVIPSRIEGLCVAAIADHAFENAAAELAVLPPTLRAVGKQAFAGSSVQALWIYDSLESISEDFLDDCTNLKTLHLSADSSPRFATSYFAAFADKMDWLRQCQDVKKMILAGGSASRYAYNSNRIRIAFPDYEPVNMGVYAYTNMLPQYQMIQQYVQAGDVLVSAPEFDATETQFCTSHALDDCFWAMMEADYGNAALLDLRDFTHEAESLRAYLRIRADMLPLAWEDTPRRYDDDGHEILYDTYNQYGDYTLIRAGAAEDIMLQHIRANYTVEAFPQPMIEALNSVYRTFEQQGVRVFFAYAPRNHSALSEESTAANRRQLHAWLKQNLCVPLLLDIEDSLYPGQYFYLIDNHLSDDGVYLHTKKIVQSLQNAGV